MVKYHQTNKNDQTDQTDQTDQERERYKLGRMSGHFETLEFERDYPVAAYAVIAALIVAGMLAAWAVGAIVEKAITETVKIQIEQELSKN